MSHDYILWICTTAYAAHVIEEYELNWRDWARSVLHLPVDWNSFYLVNAAVVVLGVCCSAVGWRAPWFALGLPALMLINATFFHVLPTIVTRVYSPGVATAVLTFYATALWAYYGAWQDKVLTMGTGVGSFALGAALMALPIVLLKNRSRGMFDYAGREDS
jgi:hypothetical protein